MHIIEEIRLSYEVNFRNDVEKDYHEAIKYWQILADKDEKNKVDYLAKIEELKSRDIK